MRSLSRYLAVLVVTQGVTVATQALPPGRGAERIMTRCVACHDTDVIVSQRLSSQAWDAEITKMTRWGAVVPDIERAELLAYLAAQFSPQPVTSHEKNASVGEATYKRACLLCHEDDLVEQQRLTSAGWGREVDKMTAWGAPVSAEDKAGLVDYLSGRRGP